MSAKDIQEKLEEQFQTDIEKLGYKLKYVEWVKEGSEWYLRFFISHSDGISIEDCEKVSRYLDPLLDQAFDDQAKTYILEVSSPGIEAPLRKEEDYMDAMEHLICVKLYEKIEGQKEFTGLLKAVDADKLILLVDKREILIPKNIISLARRAVEF